MTETLKKEKILTALSKVQEPELHKDLVTLNMIQDLEVIGDSVHFTIMLTTPACPLRNRIQDEAKAAVMAVKGVKSVEIKMSSHVPNDGRMRGLIDLPIRNAFAVASGKGGVGKSTIAVNLAVALAQSGARVGLLDSDIYGPNIPTMMGVKYLPPPLNDKFIPAEAFGVKLMSMGFLVKPGQPLIWRGPMLDSAIRQFLSDVVWGELDYLVIDLPPGTGDAALSLAQAIPLSGVVIVTLPQQVSLEDAGRSLAMFRQLDVPILGVIENMVGEFFGQGGGEQLANNSGVTFLGRVPMDAALRVSGDNGQPVYISKPESNAAKALRAIAEQVAAILSIAALGQNNTLPINLID